MHATDFPQANLFPIFNVFYFWAVFLGLYNTKCDAI